MTQNLAEHLIDLSDWGFRPNRTAEFSFYHREDGFNVRPLMVMLQEGFPIEVVEMPHSIPETVKLMMVVAHASGIDLEGNEGSSAYGLDGAKASPVRVCLVRRDLIDGECLGGIVDQTRELHIISRLVWSGLYASNNVGGDTAHQMSLNPCLFCAFLAVFMVEPASIGGGGKARRINGEVSLYRPQWTGTLLNQAFKQWRQFGILQITECTVIVGCFSDKSVNLRFFQCGGDTPTRHCGVAFKRETENHVSEWEPWPTKPIFRLLNALAQVTQQANKVFLLVSLRLVVSRPFLCAGHLNRLSEGSVTIWFNLSLNNVFYRMDMFARLVSSLKIWASAKWLAVVKAYNITSIARLGGYFPAQLVLRNLASFCYQQSSFLSRIHLNTPLTIIINNISQVTVFVNTPRNIFLIRYLTTHIYSDILEVCIRLKKMYGYSVAPDADMSGFPAIPKKNQRFVLNVIALTGKNHVRASKRGYSKVRQFRALGVDFCEQL